MEYLGSLGRLVPLRCASTEQVQAGLRYVERMTVEGRRRVQVAPASPRVWDVSWGLADPDEVATVAAFMSGAWGPGPWHWVSVRAQHGNVLTPGEADLSEFVASSYLAPGGPVQVSDGVWAARSLVHARSSGASTVHRGVPVMPGREVTVAADLRGTVSSGPGVWVGFYDSAGAQIGSHFPPVGVAGGEWQRVSVTLTPPPDAVSVSIGVGASTTAVARPQVSWTPGPVAWSAGHGCRAAVVDGLSEGVILATRDKSIVQAGFTVLEVM